MLLTIPYSHKDIEQAYRLIRWINFLIRDQGGPNPSRCLLVPNTLATRLHLHPWLVHTALKTFGEVYVHVPEGVQEKGWPTASNYMFADTVFHVEQSFGEDMFWVEPDCVPCKADWFHLIEQEWETVAKPKGKIFMGAYIHHAKPHMSGNAIYGRQWIEQVPGLQTPVKKGAWDVEFASEILPRAHYTNQILQLWKPNSTGQMFRCLRTFTALFHQDKHGGLIAQLGLERFGGRFDIRNEQEGVTVPDMPSKFYHAQNATIAHETGGYKFHFEPYSIVAGVPMGVLEISEETEQIAMQELIENPHTGITEIDAKEFEAMSKKKPKPREQQPLRAPSSPPAVEIPPSPAPVVEKADIPSDKPKETGELPSIDEAVSVGDVSAVAPPKAAKKKGVRMRPGRKT